MEPTPSQKQNQTTNQNPYSILSLGPTEGQHIEVDTDRMLVADYFGQFFCFGHVTLRLRKYLKSIFKGSSQI